LQGIVKDLEMRLSWIRMDLPMTTVLQEKGRRGQCEDRGKDWNDKSASQGLLATIKN
jgi:hypothetical protein